MFRFLLCFIFKRGCFILSCEICNLVNKCIRRSNQTKKNCVASKTRKPKAKKAEKSQ